MNKPAELVQLVDDLRTEILPNSVETNRASKAVLYLNAQDDTGIELTAEDCRLLLATPSTVDRLMDALPSGDLSLVLFDVTVTDDVRDLLERQFTTVDEG